MYHTVSMDVNDHLTNSPKISSDDDDNVMMMMMIIMTVYQIYESKCNHQSTESQNTYLFVLH